MTSFFPVFYKFTTRSAISLVYRYSLFHSLRSAKYKRCSCVLVRELTRGIQDTKLPDMVPKPGRRQGVGDPFHVSRHQGYPPGTCNGPHS